MRSALIHIRCWYPGFAVVPNVLSEEKAAAYVDQCYDWLESFDLGYKRDDPSTYKLENIPLCHRGKSRCN